ncbi:MAG: hypothetical protein JWQ40_1950 [Segetibacter sp.]|nr:hypothetical protein [Segetibacter sp.]
MFFGIAGVFMAIYFLVYLPEQNASFNLRTFRILQKISNNFKQRAENYGTAYSNGLISKTYREIPISFDSLQKGSDQGFSKAFKNSFIGDAQKIDSYSSFQQIKQDSIFYQIKKKGEYKGDTLVKPLSEILEPLIAIHHETFESVLLIKQLARTGKEDQDERKFDSILYKSPGINIANINIDSLFQSNYVEAPGIRDIIIEGIPFKMFLMPFQIPSISTETFVLIGLISEESYRRQSNNVPVDFLLTLGLILVLLLLVLPFLKIYVLSLHENINISDVRLIIAVIFIIPFVVTILSAAIWLYIYPHRFTNRVLSSLQNEVTDNFYKEINKTIQQAKEFDSLLVNPNLHLYRRDTSKANFLRTIRGIDTADLKDYLFYPKHNKNIENVHWMNADGNDVASWSFTKQNAAYFKLRDRQYFRDVKYNRGYAFPGSKDTFSIQPTLSRLTGEYTINVAMRSGAIISDTRKAIAIDISTKMYSVYNTVVPAGFGFCLINEKGDIICHSDTARSLQENLFEETGKNYFLQNAVSHKDSVLITDIDLYDQPAKMIVKPLEVLPYYLVTYYNKRSEYLFIFHIVASVFVCESILLLFVSLFSYCVMLSNKRISKLFFIPSTLNWLKPSRSKEEYYIKNSVQLISCVFFVFIFSLFLPPRNYQLYMVNISILLPLFAVTGYYIIKRSATIVKICNEKKDEKTTFFSWPKFLKIVYAIRTILFLYAVSIIIYAILQNVLFYNDLNFNNYVVKTRVWIIIIILPVISCLIAGVDVDKANKKVTELFMRFPGFYEFLKKNRPVKINYLKLFLISLLLSVVVITVIPAITFTSYALHEERKLHYQSFQVDLAKKIQQRRTDINTKIWQTKLGLFSDTATDDSAKFKPTYELKNDSLVKIHFADTSAHLNVSNSFLDSLKFCRDKGLYLFNDSLIKIRFQPALSHLNINTSPFYKKITQFLFLPPDHDEFYDDTSHNKFYYWREANSDKAEDTLSLVYKNVTDYRDPSSILLQGKLKHFYLFENITQDPGGLLVMLSIIIFIYLFYKIIYSVARRIFLVGYFDGYENISQSQDPEWLQQMLGYIDVEAFCKSFSFSPDNLSFREIRIKENDLLLSRADGSECVLKMHLALVPAYEKIWRECDKVEKFTLYDFAIDGFTNYKKVLVLYQLFQKGLLVKEEDNFRLVTSSFRNFLLTKDSAEEIKTLSKEGKGSWATMKTVFYFILIGVAVFIFISQEESSKRLITVVTSLGALLPAILKLFDTTSSAPGPAKNGAK